MKIDGKTGEQVGTSSYPRMTPRNTKVRRQVVYDEQGRLVAIVQHPGPEGVEGSPLEPRAKRPRKKTKKERKERKR